MATHEELSALEEPLEPQLARGEAGYVEGGRRVAIGRAWAWIFEGYRYFRRQPAVWLLLTLVFIALVVGLNLVPLVGWLASTLLAPVLAGGLLAGCRAIDRGGELELEYLFVGFRRNTFALMLVGLIGLALTLAAVLPVSLIGAALRFEGSMPVVDLYVTLTFLAMLALLVPVYMAMWFAPALVMLEDQSAARAVAQSFKACLRNIVTFLLYGAMLLVLAMIASIPFGLGWLILLPVVFGSVYAAYRDIYLAD